MFKPILRFGIFLFAILLCCSNVAFAKDGKPSKKEIERLYKSRNYKAVIPLLQDVCASKRVDLKWKLYLADSYLHEQNYFEALPLLPTVKKCPADFLMMMAKVYYYTYYFHKAIDALDRYTELYQRKYRQHIPKDIDLMEVKLQRAYRIIQHVDPIHLISAQKYTINEFMKGVDLPVSSGHLKVSLYRDSINGYIPIAIYNTQRGMTQFKTIVNKQGNTSIQLLHRINNRWQQSSVNLNAINSLHYVTMPFLKPDGITLYFSAKSSNGIGGYDLYLSRMDIDNNRYLTPTLLGMPFNSPFNDYLLAIDDQTNISYLVSDRFCKADSVMVYKFTQDKTNQIRQDSLSDDSLRLMAYIAIKDTISNAEQIEIKQNIPLQRKWSIYLPITTNHIITNWNDFKSPQARALYKEALKLKADINRISIQLEKLIETYHIEDVSQRKLLQKQIILKKQDLDILEQEYKGKIIDTKNLEIQSISKK